MITGTLTEMTLVQDTCSEVTRQWYRPTTSRYDTTVNGGDTQGDTHLTSVIHWRLWK